MIAGIADIAGIEAIEAIISIVAIMAIPAISAITKNLQPKTYNQKPTTKNPKKPPVTFHLAEDDPLPYRE